MYQTQGIFLLMVIDPKEDLDFPLQFRVPCVDTNLTQWNVLDN